MSTICAVGSLSTTPASAAAAGAATFTEDVVGEVTVTSSALTGVRLSGAFSDGFESADPSEYDILIETETTSCVTEMDGVTISPPAVEAFTIPSDCAVESSGGFGTQAVQNTYVTIRHDNHKIGTRQPVNWIVDWNEP
ncbi:hypothetical protein Lesp02_25080 [Lentzea sp. NBRC 105346]|nr:hypothetical protein Lesp02_25080 [Lentzea sp. NBRC 105346]